MTFTGMNAFAATGISFAVSFLALGVGVSIFSLITRYQDWQEIKKGNLAAALATGGLVIGLANVLRFAIMSNNSPLGILMWGGVGMIGMLLGWWLFDLATPQFRTDEEIMADNRAVGAVVFSIFVAVSLIVGASIS